MLWISGSFPITLSLTGLIVIFTLAGTWATSILERGWGKDPSSVVIDEVVGIWISLLFIPLTWTNLVLGLVFFRVFDIIKPLGIRMLDEKIDHPFGVMADDILAGIYANLALQVVVHLNIFA